MREYQREVQAEFNLLCRRLGRHVQQVETTLRAGWIRQVRVLLGLAEKRRAVQIRKRYMSMAKVKVGKPKTVAAPVEDNELDDLGEDTSLDDLGEEDILGDIDDLAEVDDLGVSVEDVEAAMQSITPTQKGITEAATSSLSADVAKLVKAFDGMAKAAKSEKVLESVDKMAEALSALGRGIEALTVAATKQHDWQMDAHKTLLNAVNNMAAKIAPAKNGSQPFMEKPASTPAAKDHSELDAFLKAQFEGLTTGKTFPIEKVAEVFAKRHGSATPTEVAARINVVYKSAIEKAGKPGCFSK